MSNLTLNLTSAISASLFFFGCGGGGSDDPTTTEDLSKLSITSCEYIYELEHSASAPMTPTLQGRICLQPESNSTCKSNVSDIVALYGFTLDVESLDTTITQVSSCSEYGPSEINIENEIVQTEYGVGATTGVLSSPQTIQHLVDVLRKDNLLRDPVQIEATTQEITIAQFTDSQRTSNNGVVQTQSNYLNELFRIAGISNQTPLLIPDDLRNNFNLIIRQAGGGHAGYNYVVIDGKFANIISEFSDYLYAVQINTTTDHIDFALNTILDCHLGYFYQIGNCQYLRYDAADNIYNSIVGAILYHEWGHFFLMHTIDTLRAQSSLDNFVLYSTINEDDADFIAGALTKKVGLDPNFGIYMFELMTLYTMRKNGQYINFSQLLGNAILQFGNMSATHSPLALRKENYFKGYNAF